MKSFLLIIFYLACSFYWFACAFGLMVPSSWWMTNLAYGFVGFGILMSAIKEMAGVS